MQIPNVWAVAVLAEFWAGREAAHRPYTPYECTCRLPIANYTMQDFKGGSEVDTTSGRGKTVLGDVSIKRGLLDFSEDAYNFTVFYEKYGVSARMRYTWREGFRTNDFAGGANTSGSSTFSFPVHTLDRGHAAALRLVVPELCGGVRPKNKNKQNIHIVPTS